MSDTKLIKFNRDYNLVTLSSSILQAYGVKPFHKTIKELDTSLRFARQKVCLLLFDGMGKTIVDKHLDETSFLRNFIYKKIDSVFPPTTVAATDALLSGKYPIENGWLGWTSYFKNEDKILTMFKGEETFSGEPINKGGVEVAPYKNIVTLIKEANSDIYSDSFWPSWAEHNPCKSLDDYVEKIGKAIENNDRYFIYGYWDQPDALIHENGVDSVIVDRYVKEIDKKVEELVTTHKDTTFIIIADHSLIDVKYINLDEYDDVVSLLKRPYCIEGRSPTFYVKEGKNDEFKTLFNKYFGNHFSLYSREEVLKGNLYGDGLPHPFSLEAIGDFVAVANDEYSFVQHYDPTLPLLVGHHAGGTKEEREIYMFLIQIAR